LEEIGLDRHELELYRKADMARRDRASQLETSYDKGHKKGRVEGREEGRRERDRQIARNLLKSGMDSAAVADATGLSLSDIEQLKKS
ncbi:MAG: transposase, partial [Myxococcota bacterium]